MEFTETAFRPPQEAHALLLRATQGCTHNECRFCYGSRGHSFQAASLEHMERELAEKKSAYPEDTDVYMVGANPFALPFATLRAFIATLKRYFPRFKRLGMQSMIRDVRGKNPQELRDLRELGLGLLYIGTENGNDEALRLMNKGHTAGEALEQLLRLKEAGIACSAQYILGMAGDGKGRDSAEATADFFNKARPERITTTGLTVFPDTPLFDMVRSGAFKEASEKEKIEELLLFLERLKAKTFFDSMHYLNPLNYRFRTDEGKDEVVEDIRDLLATHSAADLELMVSRHFMLSL